MAPLIVPDVCRFTVNQSIGGQPVANIIDMQIDTTGTLTDREVACERVAKDILTNWTEHILFYQVEDITAESVSWLDLDSLTGSVGAVTDSGEETWPEAGKQTSGGAMPAMVAMRIDKNTGGTRGTKRGRMYLSGMGEPSTAEGVTQSWDASIITALGGDLPNFLDGINDQGAIDPDAVQRQMVVVHQVAGNTSYTPVSSLVINPLISTQVRRGSLR